MAGLCEGGSEPPGSLKAIIEQWSPTQSTVSSSSIARSPAESRSRAETTHWSFVRVGVVRISGYGGGALWRIHGHMNEHQYTNKLENVMLPSVRVFKPENKIKFQHDLSSVHTCVAVQRWFNIHRDDSRCPRIADEMWNLIADVWDDAALSDRYSRSISKALLILKQGREPREDPNVKGEKFKMHSEIRSLGEAPLLIQDKQLAI
ncbi:hypothetical protein ANN_26020 [Periplaneta americana]|uniref:Uncharacterized protein n=1 Tax=Periplaneta americana TaxID=6978 RepID=A0ABQ8S4R6_PERAM|nr:hypothetical protein ANN_26020 [Periplaneta americana]